MLRSVAFVGSSPSRDVELAHLNGRLHRSPGPLGIRVWLHLDQHRRRWRVTIITAPFGPGPASP
jgi:hypothetical protein